MYQASKQYFGPLAKYILDGDRFLYNEAYLQCFDASREEEKLRGLVFEQAAALRKNPISAAIMQIQEKEYIVLLQYNQEQGFYFLLFLDSQILKPTWHQLENENDTSADEVIESNIQMKRITDLIKRIAPFDATVLLTGESGVGKNRFADMIHSLSERKDAPFVTINCGAIPENLLESELFGYEKGAFTGANQSGKIGLIETANHGTLFLDEIGDLPLPLQVKLLKVIQEKKITRVGGLQEKDIDFRLIAATNKDISGLVETGAFRKDLFYRLNVISIAIPPLRKRKEDISHFVHHFTEKYNEKYRTSHVFSDRAMGFMETYPWPGNVRELENIVERIILTADEDIITENMLPPNIYSETAMNKYKVGSKTLKEILQNVEEQILLETYEKYGTTTKVAEILGISQSSVSIKLNKYANKNKRQGE